MMMEIIQIAGYKNSGKTTLAMILIEHLEQSGLRVSSLKHHGHGGAPHGMENTDSEKHRSSGALFAGVLGAGIFQLATKEPWSFSCLIAIYELLETEVLVVEGFKKEPYPKIVTIRNEEDLKLLDELSNIQAVWTAVPIPRKNLPYPVFMKNETAILCHWVSKRLHI